MSHRFAAVPDPVPDSAPSIPSYDLTIRDLGQRLNASRAKLEADVAKGLPYVDIGMPRPRPDGLPPPRRKRTLRFSLAEVISWYRRGQA